MRLLPISILYTVFASVVAIESGESSEKSLKVAAPEIPGADISSAGVEIEDEEDEGKESTIFNGIEVPPLVDIEGEKFDATVKEGYWFVKHHS